MTSALRSLARNKSTAIAAAAILTLGIGMSVAMFSLVDAVLLRPLPFPRQNSIYVIWKADPLAGNHVVELAYPELEDLRRNIPDFDSVAVMPTSLYGYARVLQRPNTAPLQIESAPVSHDFFRVLGVSPALGRSFQAGDEHPGAAPAVVLSDRLWRAEFSADPEIIGKSIQLNGTANIVIGVTGPGVEFPRGAGLWVPLGTDARITERRGATFLQAIARVKPGVPPERIAAEVNAVFMRLAEEQPEFYSKSQRAVVTPIAVYWTGSARAHLWVMLAASILLLIAGVVSAGNLLLSRTLARRTEFATRMALGAGRSTLMAQLGIEAAVIALTAGLSGLALARAAIRLLIHLAPPDIPRLNGAGLHAESFLFAAGSAAVAALLCTLLPGWPAIHTPIETALREGGERTSMTRRAGRMRGFFIAAQAGVTVMLLAVASLLVLSYRAMMSADIGFANRDTVTMNLQLRGPGVLSGQAVTVDSRRAFYKLLLDRLRAAPVVTSAAAVLLRPLEGSIGWDAPYRFEFEGEARAGRVLPAANYEVVTPDYFRTVGTALIEGRDFSERDAEGTEPVAIVSRSLSERVRGAGYAPIGHRLWIGKWTRIVGVVGDARYRGIAMAGGDIFVPYRQAAPPTNYIAIRGSGSAGALAGLVRQTLAGMDPNQAIAGVATIGELIDTNAARARFNMSLLMCFGICAAVLAAGAVYSSMSEAMTARAREIAIRNALGAPRPRLVWEMLSRTLWFVLAGEIAGAGTVAAAANLAPELLYRVSARDPMVLGPVALFLFLTATGAALAPAWTAAAADPRETLRAA